MKPKPILKTESPLSRPIVALTRREPETDHVVQAVGMCGGLDHLPVGATVFVKPNIVFWTRMVDFPKYGVITTSPVVETVVRLLKDRGAGRIIIGEGTVTLSRGDVKTAAHAFESLGYNRLARRYGVEVINVLERPFEKVDTPAGVPLNFNVDFLECDFLVNLPVLKTHSQTVVSLGTKNLKGLIDIASRKRCHRLEDGLDLDRMVSLLPVRLPPSLTVIDGTYTNERGPGFDGRMRRLDLCLAGTDMLAVDMVGASILGWPPDRVPHLAHRAADLGRDPDLAGVEVAGLDPAGVKVAHEYSFPYTADGSLPLGLAKLGVSGLSYPKYDATLCTYCAMLNSVLLPAIGRAWLGRGGNPEAWDDVEVLTGKIARPTPGKKTTILLGNCMVKARRGDVDINRAVEVPGCPVEAGRVVEAFHQAGLEIDPMIIENLEAAPGAYLRRYLGKPEFDPADFSLD